MIVSEQLNYIKTRRFHAVFMPVLIEFSRCIGTYSSAKFEYVINELCRLLKVGGTLSVLKHNRAGRVMQMAVLLDDIRKANDLLDGKDGVSSQFGAIRYYEDEQIAKWNTRLKLLEVFGIRVFWHLQQNQEKHGTEEWQTQMMQLEMRVSKIEEYRKIALFHHLFFTKE